MSALTSSPCAYPSQKNSFENKTFQTAVKKCCFFFTSKIHFFNERNVNQKLLCANPKDFFTIDVREVSVRQSQSSDSLATSTVKEREEDRKSMYVNT